MNDQPVFEETYVEKRSRLTTFFRGILAIPHFIVLAVWGFIASFAVFIAWFAIVITGKYPASLYDFVAGLLRYSAAVNAYVSLLTDEYPQFGGDTDAYPAHLVLPPAKAEYSRAKTFFRIVLLIPVMIISYAMRIVWQIGSILSWIVIVIMGKQPKGLQDMTALGLSYEVRAAPYFCLVTEDWPAFTNPAGGGSLASTTASGLPPAPATTPPPAAPEAPSGSTGISGGDPLNG